MNAAKSSGSPESGADGGRFEVGSSEREAEDSAKPPVSTAEAVESKRGASADYLGGDPARWEADEVKADAQVLKYDEPLVRTSLLEKM